MSEHTYVKLEYPEALSVKRDMLLCEMSLLNLLKKVNNYRNLRDQELKIKLKLSATIRKIKKEINSTLVSMPKAEMPKIKIKHIRAEGKFVETKKHRHIEEQLQEIKEKLAELQ